MTPRAVRLVNDNRKGCCTECGGEIERGDLAWGNGAYVHDFCYRLCMTGVE